MEKNHAIDAGLETLNGLLNSFTDPGNRELVSFPWAQQIEPEPGCC